MNKIIEIITKEVEAAFEGAGFDATLGRVTISNRPDLCEYQCNGAMAGAKKYGKKPIDIANAVAEKLSDSKALAEVNAVMPGFLNLKIRNEFLADYLSQMADREKFGQELPEAKKMIIDYGGPNVAKPLHVGHLRSAVIGESVKRIMKYFGNDVYGDIHMGDWGLQMGLIIYELKLRKPELPYFDESFSGEYPEEAPFTISELEEIYPTASKKTKETDADGNLTEAAADYKAHAMEATNRLQKGDRGYRALWNHILNVSVSDLKKNYGRLHVDFEAWNGESTVHDLIPGMVDIMKESGLAYLSDGALVVDVKEESDTKEMPPCMILKSDGASLYNTTDLATLMMRRDQDDPDHIIYVVDKRQGLYFEQVFRCARKTGMTKDKCQLTFLGFGTVNGKDGKPYKTRDGGVMRLESLLEEIYQGMLAKIRENDSLSEDEACDIAEKVALAAVKYGDLSNQAAKDYIFDMEKFSSFEGDTGPYILYTIVRIKSILNKYKANGGSLEKASIKACEEASWKALGLSLTGLHAALESAATEIAPHKICAYIYDLANAFNRFYHENKILVEEDKEKQSSWIATLMLTRDVLEQCIDLLGFEAPERM